MYFEISIQNNVSKGTSSLQVGNKLGNKTYWVATTI